MNWWLLHFFLSFLIGLGEADLGKQLPGAAPPARLTESQQAFKKGKAHLRKVELDSAGLMFARAEPLYRREGKEDSAFRCSIYQVECQIFQRKLPQADSLMAITTRRYPDLIAQASVFTYFYYKTLGRIEMVKQDFDKAAFYMHLGHGMLKQIRPPTDTNFLEAYLSFADLYEARKIQDSTAYYFQKAINQKVSTSSQRYDYELGKLYYFFYGFYVRNDSKLPALTNLNIAINVFENLSNIDSLFLSELYGRKASLLNDFLDFDSALSLINKAELLLPSRNSDQRTKRLIFLLSLKASIFIRNGDAYRAINYYENILNYEAFCKGNDVPEYINALEGLGNSYYDIREFSKAKYYYLRGYDYAKKKPGSVISGFLNGIANCSLLLGDSIVAERYYKESISSRLKTVPVNWESVIIDHVAYGGYLNIVGRSKEGLTSVKRALEIGKPIFGEKNVSISSAYYWMGNIYLSLNKLDSALYYYHRAVISSTDNYINANVTSFPALVGKYFAPELSRSLYKKGLVFDSLHKRQPERMDYLTHALGNYDLSVKLLHKLRTSYQEFDSKLRVTESRRVIFQRAMEAAYRLYVRTGKEEYKEKAFEFAEKGRAIVLLSTLKEKQAMAYGGVPDSLIQKEGRLVRGIESHINLISEEQQQKPPRARVVNELEKKLFLLKSEQHDLITLFEKQYPNYYSLKYDDRVLSTASVQKRMDPGMALVEYMITADKIYAFILTRERFDIIPVDKPAGFKEKVAELENYLQDVTFFGQSRETYSKFLESSHSLYQILVEPFMSLLAGKDLVVITDEEISGIPFEVLLTQPANVNMEFGTLPYFIKQQAIGYAYSVNLMFFSPRRSIPDQLKLAAFSPAYDGQQVRGSRDGLVLKPLKYAIEEARAVCGYFSGKLYKGRKATEDVFKQVASRYDVLHLAMHAHMDDENPMHSKLAFTPAEGGAEDGMLNTYELFNLKLKARMAVLSACNTGVGKFQKGEGVMSIARGFYYAGCPDVVMTLWPVEDQMSTQLITDFYAYLNEGQNKIDALRQAKLNLIKISDPLRSHPYFWAAYVNIGDISPLVSDKSRKPRILLWTVVASLVLLVAVPLLGRRWRRKA